MNALAQHGWAAIGSDWTVEHNLLALSQGDPAPAHSDESAGMIPADDGLVDLVGVSDHHHHFHADFGTV